MCKKKKPVFNLKWLFKACALMCFVTNKMCVVFTFEVLHVQCEWTLIDVRRLGEMKALNEMQYKFLVFSHSRKGCCDTSVLTVIVIFMELLELLSIIQCQWLFD